MKTSLKEKSVILHLSDPWDLGESLKWKSIGAVIISASKDNDQDKLLLKLEEPLQYQDSHCEYFIAMPRHEGSHFDDLMKGQRIFSGLTRISHERVLAPDPFDLSWWRGGPALIGELILKEFEPEKPPNEAVGN